MAKIFLSSTYEDLQEHRLAVYNSLRELRHDVRAMEHFAAAAGTATLESLGDLAECDIYVGVLAWRYGFIPSNEKLNPKAESITALEYREACTRGIPTLIFLLNDDASWPKKFMDADGAKITAFRHELKEEHVVSQFSTADELARKVVTAVTQ